MSGFLAKLRQGGPDSTLSWLVALGGAIIYFFCIGTNRASGILFMGIMKDGNVSREDASWPFTLSGAAIIYAGPLTGYLMTVANIQIVTIVGVVIFVLGSIPCYFYTNTIFLSIFFGLIRGTGMAMSSSAIPGIVNNIFERHRATALAVALSGMSLGACLHPLLFQYVLDNYTLKQTFLIFGLISLFALIGTVPMVKPQKDKGPPKSKTEDQTGTSNPGFEKDGEPSSNASRRQPPNVSANVPIERYTKLEWISMPDVISEQGVPREKALSVSSTDFPTSLQPAEVNTPKKKLNILLSLKTILKSRGFFIITFTSVAVTTSAGIYGLTVVDYIVDKGIDEELGVYLLTANAAFEMVGSLFLGWLCDRNYLRRTIFISLTLLLAGAGVMVSAFVDNYIGLMVCSAVSGIGQGSTFAVVSVMYTDYISRENMFLAVSLTRSVAGALFLPRTPLIGLFRDHLGSYDYLFYFLAGLNFLSTVLWLLEDLYKITSARRKRSENISVR